MNYKGYKGYAIYDDEAHIFHGEVAGIRAVVTYQGKSVDELEQAFRDSIDDYIAWCKKLGKEPERPATGKFNLRMPPELYVNIAAHAAQQQMSMNTYIVNKLSAS